MASNIFKGYIYLHKKLLDNAIWINSAPFDKRSAWIDLLLLANFEDKETVSSGGDVLIVHRGQFLTSQEALAKRWKWSRGKVSRFMRSAKNQKMLNFEHVKFGKGATLITILKYNVYQDPQRFSDQQTDTKTDINPSNERTSSGTQLNKYNKDNEVNEDKGEGFWR